MNEMSVSASVQAIFAKGTATAADEQVRQESLAVAQGLKRQDVGLLDELIVRYQHRLLRYLLYLTSNREMAEDLFQEVWMRVLVRGGQFNGKARFDTWSSTSGASGPWPAWTSFLRAEAKTTGLWLLRLPAAGPLRLTASATSRIASGLPAR
jgi:hypothetical protein